MSPESKRHSAATKRNAERPAWHFFGGKGGVGKTTCAAAWALAHAETGARVLVLSTDPAHSLGDAFARPLGHAATRVPTRRGRLDAVEINSNRVVSRWIHEHRDALGRVIERGTLLDAGDVGELLTLPIPGLDELAAFLQLGRFDRAGPYDLLVIDTAPTGHTLRLLETPRLIDRLGVALGAMDARDAAVRAAFTPRGYSSEPAAIVSELHAQAQAVASVLGDPSRCEVRWVALPEPVVVAETIDGIAWLRDHGIALTGVVVNRATPKPRGRCTECTARRAHEAAALAPLAAVAAGLELRIVAERASEPRGLAALRDISADLLHAGSWRSLRAPGRPSGRREPSRSPAGVTKGRARLEHIVGHDTRVVFFGGKGGVGKTTCAATVALEAARGGRRVRLISVDPAPSLSDVLRTSVGDQWRRVGPRLLARELNAQRVLDEHKAKYRQAVSDIFDRLRGGSVFDASADRAVFERLFDLAPPGLDEIAALIAVTALTTAEAAEPELVVVDAAPTGHMLRLLAMPGDLRRWVALVMRLMLKYRLASRAELFAADLVALSRELRALSDLLRNPRRARVVAVTRPAVLPRLETLRMLEDLRRLKIPAPVLIVNAETWGTCTTCRARRRVEAREVARLRRVRPAAGRDMIHAPLALPPPRGARALLAWGEQWKYHHLR